MDIRRSQEIAEGTGLPVRNAILNIINVTDVTLTLQSTNSVHGKLISNPPSTIAPGGFGTFSVQNCDGALVGAEGSVAYTGGDISVAFNWKHGFPSSTYGAFATPSTLWAANFPQSSIGHQQVVAFWVSRTPFPYQNWMRDNFALLQSKPIYDICMPGTHDSGTYALTTTVAPSAPSFVQELKKITGDTFMSVVTAWAQSQPSEQCIHDQLMLGSRYTDLRVDYDAPNDTLRIAHGLFGPAVKDVVTQIQQFHAAHPDEFLVIAFNSLDTMTPALHSRLVSLLQSTWGNAMVDADNFNKTLQELHSTPQRLFVFYGDDDVVKQNKFLISNSMKYDPWANKDKVDDLHAFLLTTVQSRPAGKVFVLQGQLTDNNDTIIKGVVTPEGGTVPHSLEELAWMSNQSLVDWLNSDWAKTPLNIVFCDFLATSTVVPACILRNYNTPHSSYSSMMNTMLRGGVVPPAVRRFLLTVSPETRESVVVYIRAVAVVLWLLVMAILSGHVTVTIN
eukprot:PhM_4_TR16135/c2_g3_i1/m.5412